jgi:hypothetical protein
MNIIMTKGALSIAGSTVLESQRAVFHAGTALPAAGEGEARRDRCGTKGSATCPHSNEFISVSIPNSKSQIRN